jgi:putative membrane protein
MPSPSLSLTDWTWEPTVVAGLIAACAAYWLGWRRGAISGRDDVTPWGISSVWRRALFALGILTSLLALCSPIDRGGDEFFFWIHMIQHLMLMVVAPPLLLLGIAGAASPPADRLPRLRALWTAITRPWPALVIFNAVLLIWHVPALYDTTLTVLPVHVFEHITFMLAGFIFWWPVVDPIRSVRTRPVTSMQKVALLTLCGVPATIVGLLFSLAPRPFYDFYARAPRLWGISAVTDQQFAGAVMFGAGNIIFFAVISVIFLRMFGDPEADERAAGAEGLGARPRDDAPTPAVR